MEGIIEQSITSSVTMTAATLERLLPAEKLKGRPSPTPDRSLSGRLWPTGEFSYGVVRHRPDERLDDRPIEGHWEDAPVPLDLSNVPNSHTPPQCLLSGGETALKPRSAKSPRRGMKGITGYGKKMVKSVGALIGKQFPRHRVTFATVTMPAMERKSRIALAQEWPALVRELLQWLSRRCSTRGVPKVVVSVTEIQPVRLEQSGEGYLHLHLLWLNPPAAAGKWTVDVLDMRTWLTSWLTRRGLFPEDSHINVDVRPVKGSVANYLAKYVSKGSDTIAEYVKDCGEDAVPSAWWNMTRTAREWVKSNIRQGREVGERLAQWLNWAFDYDNFELFRYIYHVEIELDGVLLTVGYRGALTESALDTFGLEGKMNSIRVH